MIYEVDVDETVYTVRTYLIKATSPDKAKAVIKKREWLKVKLLEYNDYAGEVRQIIGVRKHES